MRRIKKPQYRHHILAVENANQFLKAKAIGTIHRRCQAVPKKPLQTKGQDETFTNAWTQC